MEIADFVRQVYMWFELKVKLIRGQWSALQWYKKITIIMHKKSEQRKWNI